MVQHMAKKSAIAFVLFYGLIMSGAVTVWADQSGIGLQLNGLWGYYYDDTEYNE